MGSKTLMLIVGKMCFLGKVEAATRKISFLLLLELSKFTEIFKKIYIKVYFSRLLRGNGKITAQIAHVVRSAGTWSAGIKTTEHSIQNAYVQMIEEAKHFIYIENQFFISIIGHKQVHNRIGHALYRRILRAHTYV
ncbi:unnamed protein product [Didymodactylos carnosus]|uniref:Uncharacterized protein n=1 Tax=Didymodactylos carnosus TaxID=1234261 RepID=A0A8S2ERI7_9BILA|nr:unnamed protein product [Didymodactylos carnosus]CAF4095450.1 unnamed protein product [Didymodactylos carnosus]